MNILFSLAMAMAFGLLLSRAMKLLHLPNVTGFLIAGLLIGPYCLRLFPSQSLEEVGAITTVALGFIAFSIGGEFKLSHIKQIGSKAISITMFQALMATLLVDVTLYLFGFPLPVVLTLGAIATATAPAATLMVVRQYKAKGPVTSTLLPVVAMDDAVGLVVFAISLALAQAFGSGQALSLKTTLVDHLVEIVLSLAVGLALGALVAIVTRFFQSRSNKLCVCIAAVLLGVALSEMWDLSSLLLCMSIGAAFVNLKSESETAVILEQCDRWTPPLFMLFFVISGAELDLAVIPTVGLLGVLYLLARSLGKYFGAYLGSTLVKAHPHIRRYLGITLLPQAGVAIGMAQVVIGALPDYGPSIRAVVLCATLVYELVGPLLTKWALTRAGEILPAPKARKASGLAAK